MIPKIIHYCWFGKQAKPHYILKCMQSWQEFLPEYEMVEWNEDNTDLSHPFIQKALQLKMWAFVADFVRAQVLKQFGGIYLDTDMLFFKPLPASFLSHKAFIGCENKHNISAGVIGSVKNGAFVERFSSYYNQLGHVDSYEQYIIPKVLNHVVKLKCGVSEIVYLEEVVIFPPEYFYALPIYAKEQPWSNYVTEKSICVHLWAGSWLDTFEEDKEPGIAKAERVSWHTNILLATEDIEAVVDKGATFILIDGDELPLGDTIAGRRKIALVEKNGQYWGPPPNDETAIEEIELQRERGVSSIIFAWPTFWWLDYYAGMHDYLKSNYELIVNNERLIGFSLQKARQN